MIAFGGQKRLGHAQIDLLQGFNSKLPTSIPTSFIWESPPVLNEQGTGTTYDCIYIVIIISSNKNTKIEQNT